MRKRRLNIPRKVNSHYSKIRNDLEAMRSHYGDETIFLCGYEAKTIARCLAHHDYSTADDAQSPADVPNVDGQSEKNGGTILTETVETSDAPAAFWVLLFTAAGRVGIFKLHSPTKEEVDGRIF